MKFLFLSFVFISASAFASNPFTLKEKECFDPRAALFQCPEGETFQGWIVGSCTDGLVEAGNCVQSCFDPKAVLFVCEEGKEFKGWNVGTCQNGEVANGICE